jgi:hypothetical protein
MGIPKPLVQANQLFIVILVLLGLVLSEWILLIPFALGVFTLITKQNVIMNVGRRFLRKTIDQYTLEDKDQQLFNQWIATICLGLSILFFYIDFQVFAYIFSIMVVLAAGIALLGYCIGCTIRYRYLMWKHRQKKR